MLHDSKKADESKELIQKTRMTTVSNFDSTEQATVWSDIVKQINSDSWNNKDISESKNNVVSFDNLWIGNKTNYKVHSLLHRYPKIRNYFAGIIRTAYLYSPHILITDAELFDGIFFLLFGPKDIADMLTNVVEQDDSNDSSGFNDSFSYSRNPSIIIRGRGNNIFESFLSFFTVKNVKNVKEDNGLENGLENGENSYRLRPLKYCIFGKTLSKETVENNPDICKKLTHNLNIAKGDVSLDCVKKQVQSVADAFEEIFEKHDLGKDGSKSCGKYDFLAQRWYEWIEACENGLVKYEKNENFEKFKGIFVSLAEKNSKIILNACKEEAIRLSALQKISANKGHSKSSNTLMEQYKFFEDIILKLVNPEYCGRSKAFNFIDEESKRLEDFNKVILESTAKNNAVEDESLDSNSKTNKYCTQKMLKDWYQFVYLRAISMTLDAYMTTVNAKENSYAQVAYKYDANSGKKLADGHKSILNFYCKCNPKESIALAGEITSVIGGMPNSVFANFCYKSQTAIKKWRACGPQTSFKKQKKYGLNIAYLVDKAKEDDDIEKDRKDIFKGFIGVVLFAFISVLCDKALFNDSSIPVYFIILISWIVSILPEALNMFNWIKRTHTACKTIVFFAS